jgi:hypothetical protein
MEDALHVEVLVEHVRRALVHELGTTTVEAWLGKDGAFRHVGADLARITVEALAPEVNDIVAARIVQLHANGVLAPPLQLDPDDW